MPPADNDPIAPASDGEKLSLITKCFLDRFKGPKSTKSSSAASTLATQLMDNWIAPSAADEKPSFSKCLLAPFKGSKFIKSSSAPGTPAAQSVEKLAAPSTSAAQLVANTGVVTTPGVLGASASAQGVDGTHASSFTIPNQVLIFYTAAGIMSAMNVNQGGPATLATASPTSVMNVDEHSSVTAVTNLVVSHNNLETLCP
ncbi:hypothetical protein DXG01_012863 [Tephrocybe rancida]|nr:hypothetical protein DXG01_012863 [Tephrocybe rancida]